MKYIIGLGNIGSKYEQTRHNIGFMAIDAFAAAHQVAFSPSKHFALTAKVTVAGEPVMLVKPTTYMNDSGKAVRAVLDYFGGAIDDDVLVLVDDMDLPFGKLRFRGKGSAGGHNGLKSIMAHTDSQTFLRLKFGLGHPERDKQVVINYVLGKFTPTEMPAVEQMLDRSVAAMTDWIKGADVAQLSNQYNG
ncbi:aminoacyl-tRNA hydrolase [Leuconostoc lactis]|uniref:aminoacyl-tRNA hydrolase n=1 Tax=Leuconostoc lactis TaxID=1246 RepID=UPI001C1FED3B|nr:aminoacyl-tRNA hydrolase [Leuconostoc lactis]MBU7537268.1 aminoacyl-tRNA hydrolase [Leuconostoc lactis]MDI6495848.1 aminoacyl-tRNA hydrolase [Leuconostoc lactis]MDI6573050.1 aminoacyl-tRNA hydrolase [Leuconostoc lactis]